MFRLLPPLIVRAGVGFGAWLALQAVVGLVVFAFVARISNRHLQNRVASVGVVLGIAATYIGGQYSFDDHAYFDTLAVAGLVGALNARSYPAQIAWLLVAVWTDERAAVATIAVLTYAVITRDRSRAFAATTVLVIYAGGRLYLGSRYGLSTPTGPNWIGAAIGGLDVGIPGLWMALKGLWVFPAVGIYALLSVRRRFAAAALLASVTASSAAALAVLDTTRSAAYLLPAVLCGVAAMERSRESLRINSAYIALVASLALPTFYVVVPEVAWILPLPLQLLPSV